MEPLIIIGGGGNTRVIMDMIALAGRFSVHGIIDDNPDRTGQTFEGAPILGTRDILPDLLARGIKKAVVGVGAAKSTAVRNRIFAALVDAGFEIPAIVHPTAVIARSATLSDGVLVMASVTINPGTSVGRNVLINTGSIVEHDCTIEDGAFLGPGVTLAGNTRVGLGAFVGVGAVTIQSVSIGEDSLIAAGAVLISDVPARHFARGVPAKCRPLEA